jgi:hypothetical protein
VARENSSVEARENSSVEARENSSVVARGNSSVVARENSSINLYSGTIKSIKDNAKILDLTKDKPTLIIPKGLKVVRK